jgi:hypothetical protein
MEGEGIANNMILENGGFPFDMFRFFILKLSARTYINLYVVETKTTEQQFLLITGQQFPFSVRL